MNNSVPLPGGFRASGVACGIKRDPAKLDLTLVVSDRPAAAAGVFTRNRVAAAPVRLSRTRVPSDQARAVVANSGNANACTGAAGLANARRMTDLVATGLGSPADAVLVCSTGVIGEPLPMARIELGIARALDSLSGEAGALERAARGIMTTDTVPKLVTRDAELDGTRIRVSGIAKGAAMIGPNMGTMLSFLLTDARIAAHELQGMLARAVERSFNCISVEGHTSTNDTVLALASGAAGAEALSGEAADRFAALLADACTELAQKIVRDAEGAKHFVTIDVVGMASEPDALRIAQTVAGSPLVKTAIYGADPNWGRFVSAAGYAGVPFDEMELRLWLNGTLLFERGAPVPFDARAVSERLRGERDVDLRLEFSLGTASCRWWTCDLTEEYVRLNADYHT